MSLLFEVLAGDLIAQQSFLSGPLFQTLTYCHLVFPIRFWSLEFASSKRLVSSDFLVLVQSLARVFLKWPTSLAFSLVPLFPTQAQQAPRPEGPQSEPPKGVYIEPEDSSDESAGQVGS